MKGKTAMPNDSSYEIVPNNPLACIVCDRLLEHAMSPGTLPNGTVLEETTNQPYGGTVFYSHGQYGSTVFDETTGAFLEITVCDKCLVKAGKEGKVLHGVTISRPETAYEPWRG
jgi:hypothetical protein